MFLRLFSRAPTISTLARRLAPLRRHRDRPRPRQELPGQRLRDRLDLRRRARARRSAPPCSPAPGPMSTTWSAARIVSSSCSTTSTVLPRSRSRSSVAISLALSRWCRPIDGSSSTYSTPDERRADLRRQPDPLRLAARQRRRAAVERQVAEADVVEEPQPLVDLAQDQPRDVAVGLRQLQLVDPRARAPHAQRRELVDRHARRRAPHATPAAAASRGTPGTAGPTCTPRSSPATTPSRSPCSAARGWGRSPRIASGTSASARSGCGT